MTTTLRYEIDWDNDGFGAADNITEYVIEASAGTGFKRTLLIDDRVAPVGTCSIVLRNEDKRFSPAYTSGALYGKLLPGRPVRITAVSGGSSWVIFRGETASIAPMPGVFGGQTAIIYAEDMMARLRDTKISLPLQETKTADYILKLITSAAWRTAQATGTITFAGQPSDGNTLTIDTVTYRFKTTLAALNDVLIGADLDTTMTNLVAAINATSGAGTTYYSGTVKHETVTAGVDTATDIVTVTAVARGAWANTLALSRVGANMTVSGTTLAGGVDGPAGLFSYEAGQSTFTAAGQGWIPTETRAVDAISDVCNSEWGLFWAARDGTLTFKNRAYPFARTVAASSATFSGTFTGLNGELSVNDVINRVRVMFQPTNNLSSGVVARARSAIEVPGAWGQDYKNPADDIPSGGSTVITLPFVDPTTGDLIGAKSLTLPLVATTDYTVNEQSDGSGVDYTSTTFMNITVAVRGSGVEISFRNTAGGRLYVRNLQVRGVGIVAYEPTEYIQDDTTSLNAYGVRPYTIQLPLSSTAVSNLAAAISQHLVNRYSTASYRVAEIEFEEIEVGVVNLASLNIGDIVTITESQTGITSVNCMILGVQFRAQTQIDGQAKVQTALVLYRLDDHTYWKLDDSTYSKLGSTTRLAI